MTLPATSQDQLRQYVEQIERLEQEKKAVTDDIREKYKELSAVGFDKKTVRELVKLRKKSKADREEQESILTVYMHAPRHGGPRSRAERR